jgi:hypothetical protein
LIKIRWIFHNFWGSLKYFSKFTQKIEKKFFEYWVFGKFVQISINLSKFLLLFRKTQYSILSFSKIYFFFSKIFRFLCNLSIIVHFFEENPSKNFIFAFRTPYFLTFALYFYFWRWKTLIFWQKIQCKYVFAQNSAKFLAGTPHLQLKKQQFIARKHVFCTKFC